MNKFYAFSKIICFVFLTFGMNTLVKAQIDTIPPKIYGCGDTIKIKVGSVFVLKLPKVTDNLTDSAEIMVSSQWGANGAVNTTVKGVYTLKITAIDTAGNLIRCERYYLVGDQSSSVKNIQQSLQIKTYPNPVNDLLFVQCNAGTTFMLYGMDGKLLREDVIDASSSINMNAYADGVYMLKVINGADVYSSRIMVQH